MLTRKQSRGLAIGLFGILAILPAVAFLPGCAKPEQGDTEPPKVSLTNPGDGTEVTGTVNVTAHAEDNDAVTRVDFVIDSTLAGSDNSEPYSHLWNTIGLRSGTEHTVQVFAYDPAGNEGSSPEAIVTIGPEQPTVHCGTISTDETWLAFDNPHVCTCDVDVAATLTLEPGVIVKFEPGTALRVGWSSQGALVANGAAGSRITFTSNVSPPAPGDWRGIAFGGQTDDAATVLNHCLIEYGGSDSGNVYCLNASPTITYCKIRHSSKYGVYCQGDGFTDFSYDTVTACGEYPLHMNAGHVHTLGTRNSMTGNAKDWIEVEAGYIDSNCTWVNQGVPYRMKGNLLVGGTANPLFMIGPYTVFEFPSGAGMRVGYLNPGAVIADGSSGTIVFSSTASPSTRMPGDWQGITFEDSTMDAQTVLRYCRIEYGGGNGYGNIYCRGISSAMEIDHCALNYSLYWGIYLENSDPYVHHCTFWGNIEGGIGP